MAELIEPAARLASPRVSAPLHRCRRRGSGLLRTLIVAAATLAVLLVCFSMYQFTQMEKGERGVRPPVRRLPSPLDPRPVADESATVGSDGSPGGDADVLTSQAAVGGAVVGPGRDIKLSIFPSEGTKARMEIAVRSWQPAGPVSDEFLLVDPEIRLRTNDGRAIRVTGNEGVLEARPRSGGGLDPRRGRLVGDIRMEIDRLTEKERQLLPPERRTVIDPKELVIVELDVIQFDLEYGKIVVPDGMLHLSAEDVDFRASDLEVRFDERANRIDYLRIARGGRLELKGASPELKIPLPGLEESESGSFSLVQWLRDTVANRGTRTRDGSAAKPSDTAPPSGPSGRTADGEAEGEASDGVTSPTTPSDPGIPVFRLSGKDSEEHPRPEMRYVARFEQDVEARRMSGDTTEGQLNAAELEVVRSTTPQDRERLTYRGGDATTPQDQPGDRTTAGESVVVEWSGLLRVELCTPDDERCAGDMETRITARGTDEEPVRLFGTEGAARCDMVRFEPTEGRIWMEGSAGRPVEVRSPDQGVLTGLSLRSERLNEAIDLIVQGPGALRRDAPAEIGAGSEQLETVVEFAGTMSAGIHVETRTRIDLRGMLTRSRVRVLDRALFTDGVTLRQGDASLDARRFEADFDPSVGVRSNRQTVKRVLASGEVRLVSGKDRLNSDDLEVLLSEDRGGRIIPVKATAKGNIDALQEGRSLRADHELVVDFQLIERSRPQSDGSGAPREAVQAAGDQPSSAQASRETVSAISGLQARGNVRVVDPVGDLDVLAEELLCSIVGGREMEWAQVAGTEARPASVRLEAFTVDGVKLQLHLREDWAEVPGPGRMTFRSLKDLDGRRVEEPIPVSVTWLDGMRYEGQENRAVFSGGVHAASVKDTTFDSGQLLIEFDDIPPEVTVGTSNENLWIFADLVRWRPIRREPGSEVLKRRMKKEPVYVLASGDAVAETSEVDPKSGALRTRARLSGPKLSVNLRTDVSKLLIEGPGELLLEDFRPGPRAETPPVSDPRPSVSATTLPGSSSTVLTTSRKDARTPSNALGMGLFSGAGDEGPSKTLIRWSQYMWYDFSIDQTRFGGDVGLTYVSGGELERLFGSGPRADSEPTSGRTTFLTSEMLTVDFLGRGNPSRRSDDARFGRLSAERLRQFQASGAVMLQDQTEGLYLTSEDLTYERERDVLIVQGRPGKKAHIVIQKPGEYPRDINVERFFYNLRTKAVEARGGSGRVGG